jgi:hypothetical protein
MLKINLIFILVISTCALTQCKSINDSKSILKSIKEETKQLSSSCVDKNKSLCKFFTNIAKWNRTFCAEYNSTFIGPFNEDILTYCPVSCNKCPCKDESPLCSLWLTQSSCDYALVPNKTYLYSYCRQTCNRCLNGTQTTSTTTTTTTTTVSTPIPSSRYQYGYFSDNLGSFESKN